MLCQACHVHVDRSFAYCLRCGTAIKGARHDSLPPADLVVAGGTNAFTIAGRCLTIGRNPDNDVVLGDGRASRYHARVWRETDGYRVEDLDSLNGTVVAGEPLRGQSRTLNDQDRIVIAGTTLVFDQPRGGVVPGRTYVELAETMIEPDGEISERVDQPPPGPTSRLEQRPRRRSGWALKRMGEDAGGGRYVLRNSKTGKYLQLTERDHFLWERMDGSNTVRDLLFLYAMEYGQMALPRIEQLLAQLYGMDLVAGIGRRPPPQQGAGLLRRVGRAVMNALLRMEFAIGGIDGHLERFYRSLGWRAFTPIGLASTWILALVGVAAFAFASTGPQHRQPFDLATVGVIGVVIAVASFTIVLTLHELAHAMATKSYGRRIRRAGFMMMLGMPYAFVDTTDMWLEGRWPRIVVSLAGPVATLAVACFFSLGAVFGPIDTPVPGICFLIAFGLYMNTLYSFNPLVPTDGYYALSDVLNSPRLREDASAYFRSGLWKDLRHGRMPGGRQMGLTLYGALSTVATLGFIALGFFAWQRRFGSIVRDHVPAPFDSLIVIAGVLLIMFPIWFGPLSRLWRAIKRRRMETRERRPAPLEALEA